MLTINSNITEREREIIGAISQGLSSKEISEKFFISVLTVKTHRKNIMQKIKVRNMAHLVRRSYELGLIDQGGYTYNPYLSRVKAYLTG